MKIPSKIKSLLILFLVSSASSSIWSQVWPGDINNNGIVNAVDWLYLVHALGEEGPARPGDQMGIDWEEKTITSLWGTSFPSNGVDLVFADCDGDGLVTPFDEQAILSNFLEEHEPVDIDVTIAGIDGIDPKLFFRNESTNPFQQGGVLFLELHLGTEDIPVEAFNGITFDIAFDSSIVNFISFIPAENDSASWEQNDLIPFEFPDTDQLRSSFAFSTFDMTSIENGYGLLGRFFIVIEDDVVGMQGGEEEAIISLENVILLEGDLNVVPIVNDTINITIVENPLAAGELLNPDLVKVYPNPTSDYIYLETNYHINTIEVFNTIGQVMKIFNAEDQVLQKLEVSDLPSGMFLLKIQTDDGILAKKIFIN